MGEIRKYFFIFFLCLWACVLDGRCPDDYCTQNFPNKLLRIISMEFPGLRIKKFSDFDEDHKKIWRRYAQGDCPGVAEGHFIEKSRREYAALLIPIDKKGIGYKIIIAFVNRVSKYEIVTLIDNLNDKGAEDMDIGTVPPGDIPEFDSGRLVRINNNGLRVESIESSSQIYFWKNGQFESIFVKD